VLAPLHNLGSCGLRPRRALDPAPTIWCYVKHKKYLCEACRSAAVERVVDADDPEQPYHVCAACARRLETCSLRPLEWFNLAAIHSPYKYLLHEDFYDEQGVAEQPRQAVQSPEHYPAPTFQSAQRDLERLLDYAMTRWRLENKVVRALGNYDKEDVLNSLRQRVEKYPNFALESMAYEICTTALGQVAGDWIRERWRSWRPRTLFTLSYATASCLPFDEGYNKVVQALMDVPPQELAEQCSALAWFRSARNLDWLEDHTGYMANDSGHVTDNWGRLAALSDFSWERASAWLDKGRPLSLVALAALKACYSFNTGLLERYKPKLARPAPVSEMASKLRDYAAKYPAPRVQTYVDYIVSAWSKHERNL
jgi:hypothetical protein